MFSLISVIIGLIGLPFGILAFFPLLGWGYWFVVPFAILGYVFAAIGGSSTGKALNGIVIVIGIIRLFMGGGIF